MELETGCLEHTRRIDSIESQLLETNRQLLEVMRIVSQIEHRVSGGVVNPVFEQDDGNQDADNNNGEALY